MVYEQKKKIIEKRKKKLQFGNENRTKKKKNDSRNISIGNCLCVEYQSFLVVVKNCKKLFSNVFIKMHVGSSHTTLTT